MRVNVYSQELDFSEPPVLITQQSNTGIKYGAVRFTLRSSPYLHHPPSDDDRSAVTFWLPKNKNLREALAKQFEEAARVVREAPISGMD